jgi:hypothetical protein
MVVSVIPAIWFGKQRSGGLRFKASPDNISKMSNSKKDEDSVILASVRS